MAKPAADARPNPAERIRNFAVEVRNEMAKVTWPTKADLKSSTTVVLMFLGFLSVIVGVMDIIFQTFVLGLFRLT